MKNMFQAMGSWSFLFYISFYFLFLFFSVLVLYSYGFMWENKINSFTLQSNLLMSLFFMVDLIFMFCLLLKSLKDLKKWKIIMIIFYLLSFCLPFLSTLIWDNNFIILLFMFMSLHNPAFPMLLIIFLCMKKWKLEENFWLKLMQNKVLWAFFASKKLKKKMTENKFIVGMYPILFALMIMGSVFQILILIEWGDLMKYTDAEIASENNTMIPYTPNWLEDDWMAWIIIYFLLSFLSMKIIPVILYIFKVPFSMVFFYLKSGFSHMEEMESTLKK